MPSLMSFELAGDSDKVLRNLIPIKSFSFSLYRAIMGDVAEIVGTNLFRQRKQFYFKDKNRKGPATRSTNLS